MVNDSVVAKLHNQASYEEGAADAALTPGQGCVIYEDANGDNRVRAAGADELTTRIVREQRNPPRAVGAEGASPIDHGYDAGNHVESVGFQSFDQARARITYQTDANGNPISPDSGTAVGWGADGNLTTAAAEPVARVREDYGGGLVRVEFL